MILYFGAMDTATGITVMGMELEMEAAVTEVEEVGCIKTAIFIRYAKIMSNCLSASPKLLKTGTG